MSGTCPWSRRSRSRFRPWLPLGTWRFVGTVVKIIVPCGVPDRIWHLVFLVLSRVISSLSLLLGYQGTPTGVVVKMTVPFGVPNIMRHVIFRVPKKGP